MERMVSNPSGFSLECISGNLEASTFEITEDGVTMGRGEFNTAVLNSGNVSRRHARVFLFEGVPYAQDVGSRNGVFVNTERISEQQRLEVGDTFAVGEFSFKISGPAGSAGSASNSKKTPFFVVGGVLLALVAGGGFMMTRGGGDEPVVAPPTTETKQASGNLFDFKAPSQGKVNEAKKAADVKNIDVASTTLAKTGEGSDKTQVSLEQRNKIVKDYLERGLSFQDMGRFSEAKQYYSQALGADPACELCRSRLERVERQMEETRQKRYDDALRYYNSLRYDEAVKNWEVVLNLTEDKNSPMYLKTVEYIKEARGKLEAGRF